MKTRTTKKFDNRPSASHAWYFTQRILAGISLVLLLPVFIVLFVFVRTTSRGPFLYSQRRPGYQGRPFTIWKIRTMRDGADRDKTLAICVQLSNPQVTSVGKILRQTKLDELPQLWNVVKGEMALVGPRPIAFNLFEQLRREISGFSARLSVLPGLTNLGQVCIEENSGIESVVDDWRLRFEAEKHYLEYRCFSYDVVIVSLTLLYLIRKTIRVLLPKTC